MEETLARNALIPGPGLGEVEGGGLARAERAVGTEAAAHQPEDPAGQTKHMALSSA